LARKRDNVEGASLFSILPRRRDGRLLKLLVAYQIMWDFLDSVSERGACAGPRNGRQLHRALVEALDPDAPISDYYRHHPWKDDGGYLLALVETCRRMCAELPSYRQVRQLMLPAVERCAIQSLNHEPEPARRDAALREWAEGESGQEPALSWFELTAAAGAFVPHVLLALASEPSCECHEVSAVYSAYFPWVSLAIAMLDSYVDRADDAANGSHSYISHYATEAVALDRLATIIRRTLGHARSLPNGRRHAVLTEGIVAMHLSIESANTPGLRAQTRELARAGGPLTRLLLPIAHLWRATRPQRFVSSDADEDLPPSLPLPTVAQTFVFWRSPFAYCEQCRRRHGSRFTLRATSYPLLVILSDRADIKAMLDAPADVLHPGEGGAKVMPIVGASSFMLLDGEEHLSGRRAVLPALRKRTVHRECDWVIDLVRRTVASWPRDVAAPLHPRLRALTLEVILRRIFAWREPGSEERLRALRDRVLAMLSVTGSAVFPVPALRHGPGRVIWERFLRQRSDVDELIYAAIDERRAAGDHVGDLLDRLLAAHNPDGSRQSCLQVRDNVMTMLVSGHETTSAQLAWAFQLLAHNPAVQGRLIEEIDAGVSDDYLTATIQEVLRHRPVFLFTIPRAVKRPIEIGGWTYEPPTHLLGCIYLLHHDPAIYPAPHEFRPERFLEGQPSPHAWLPWGGGRRRCPGSHLAMLEMKTVLRTVLSSMTIDPAGRRVERPRWRSVIVTPHAGSRVVLRRRKRNS
ncbi:MAG TPA: cytochrome P450, partial [Solirubrobacteraceae bacterium]|nr:cytochrome P450 [Solirubrobacteraceae bacterium]